MAVDKLAYLSELAGKMTNTIRTQTGEAELEKRDGKRKGSKGNHRELLQIRGRSQKGKTKYEALQDEDWSYGGSPE